MRYDECRGCLEGFHNDDIERCLRKEGDSMYCTNCRPRGRILKYPINHRAVVIPCGPGTRILSAGHDLRGVLCVWAEVVPGILEAEVRKVWTGQEAPSAGWTYLATVQDGGLMEHIYVRVPR